MQYINVKQITIRSLRQPTEEDIDNDIEWFCESLGLLGERDRDKTGLKIFKSILKAKNSGISAEDLSEKANISRTAVIHHTKTMINSGLIVKEGGIFELRMRSLQKVVDEIRLDMERVLKSIREIAEDIDREFMLPVREKRDNI